MLHTEDVYLEMPSDGEEEGAEAAAVSKKATTAVASADDSAAAARGEGKEDEEKQEAAAGGGGASVLADAAMMVFADKSTTHGQDGDGEEGTRAAADGNGFEESQIITQKGKGHCLLLYCCL